MVTAIPPDAPAQSIVELFNQLAGQGYSSDDLLLIHRAYALAVRLYSCYYRSSGRPLVTHAVSTSSVIAALASPAPAVAVMVLHAAYLHGDFGTRMRRIDAGKRARVRGVIGEAAEEVLYRFSALPWREATIPSFAAGLAGADPIRRQIALMRLADQIDIYGTRDALYTCNLAQRHQVAQTYGPQIVGMAEQLGYPALAAALARAYREFAALAPLPGLDGALLAKDGVVLPRSYRTRPSIALYQRARTALWRWVGR